VNQRLFASSSCKVLSDLITCLIICVDSTAAAPSMYATCGLTLQQKYHFDTVLFPQLQIISRITAILALVSNAKRVIIGVTRSVYAAKVSPKCVCGRGSGPQGSGPHLAAEGYNTLSDFQLTGEDDTPSPFRPRYLRRLDTLSRYTDHCKSAATYLVTVYVLFGVPLRVVG